MFLEAARATMLIHLITDFAGKGGAQTMLARLLSASEERTTVVALGGVSPHYQAMSRNPGATFVAENALSLGALPGAISRIAQLFRRERPRAIVCWMYHAMVVGTIAGALSRTEAPIYWTVRQSLDDPSTLSRSTRAALAASKLLSGKARGIIYNSSRAKALHEDYGFASRNAIVIPNGFELPDATGIEPIHPPVFGFAGRFHPQKDFESFFRAAALAATTHPQARFAAAGEKVTASNPEIAGMMSSVGLNPALITLQGELDDMAPFYRSLHAFVLASRTEGFPNVIAEAMSYGKPVISTDVGDAAAVIGDTGFVVPPRDPEALGRAMSSLLELPRDRYMDLAAAARERIRSEYSLPAIAGKYRNFITA